MDYSKFGHVYAQDQMTFEYDLESRWDVFEHECESLHMRAHTAKRGEVLA